MRPVGALPARPRTTDSSRTRARRRFWVFNHYAVLPSDSGGTRHFDLSRALANRGYETTIFASSQSYLGAQVDGKSRTKLVVRRRVAPAIEFLWVRTSDYRGNGPRRILNMLTYGAMAILAQLRLQSPAIVFGSSPHPVAAFAALIVARLRRVPFVYECRDLWPRDLVALGVMSPQSITARALLAVEAVLFRRAERIVVLQEAARGYVEGRGVAHEKIEVIPNGAPIDSTSLAHAPVSPAGELLVRAIQQWSADGQFVVVYIGAHGLANGLDLALAAARLLLERRDLRFVFVGNGPEKARLIQLAGEWNLNNVAFFEPLPKTDMQALLTEAGAGLVCLAKGTSGSVNKLFDYLKAGLPVIFAGEADVDAVGDHGLGITIRPLTASALATGVGTLANMATEERRQIGERGREYLRRHHNSKDLGDRLADLLDELAP